MMQIIRSTSLVALVACVAFAFGCGDSGGGNGGNGGNGGSNTTGETCSETCSDGSECASVSCACKDGTTVDTQSCNNGCCETEAAACPGACADHGGWGSGGGGGGTGADLGESCSQDSDCASGLCFPVNLSDESDLQCTIECSFGGGECPSGWECAEVQGGAATLCILQ